MKIITGTNEWRLMFIIIIGALLIAVTALICWDVPDEEAVLRSEIDVLKSKAEFDPLLDELRDNINNNLAMIAILYRDIVGIVSEINDTKLAREVAEMDPTAMIMMTRIDMIGAEEYTLLMLDLQTLKIVAVMDNYRSYLSEIRRLQKVREHKRTC